MEYSTFNAIKDTKRYLTGEGGAGMDNNNGPGAAINAQYATKDKEVGQGTEGGGKGGTGKEDPRQRTPSQRPPSLPPRLSRLRREMSGGWGMSYPPMAPL